MIGSVSTAEHASTRREKTREGEAAENDPNVTPGG
jgi:hypothetical protein